MIKKIIHYIIKPRKALFDLLIHYNELFPDRIYLELLFFIKMGKRLNLNNPHTFNEKLQWLKLYNRRPEYTNMVDKYAVKDYISTLIGAEYVIPTLGKWLTPSEIEWDYLPEQFVLKTTHGGGGTGVVICKDKSSFDKQSAMKLLNDSLQKDISKVTREWPYRDVHKCIIAEQFLPGDNDELKDYKFFCFNGKVKMYKIDFDRFVNHRANYYSASGEILEFGEAAYPPDYKRIIIMPDNISLMISLAERISYNHPFMRVDFYEYEGHVYFGEITLFPAAGFGRFTDKKWDDILGSWLVLPRNPSALHI